MRSSYLEPVHSIDSVQLGFSDHVWYADRIKPTSTMVFPLGTRKDGLVDVGLDPFDNFSLQPVNSRIIAITSMEENYSTNNHRCFQLMYRSCLQYLV